MHRSHNGTLKVLGLALGVLVVLLGGAVAWGRLDATQADHERRILAVEAAVEDIPAMYLLVKMIAANDGIEVPE